MKIVCKLIYHVVVKNSQQTASVHGVLFRDVSANVFLYMINYFKNYVYFIKKIHIVFMYLF